MPDDDVDTVLLPPSGGRRPDGAARAFRPVRPSAGVSRWLRSIAGVKEDILDWVPEERARYTRLGAIVINTGALAGISLFVALTNVVDTAWALFVPVALFWAYVVISFDGWLLASTHGAIGAGRLRVFIPRLLLSVLIGAVIAEPLVLWVFQPAIEKEVLDLRRDEMTAYESRLKVCNPETGGQAAAPSCGGYLLSLADSPQAGNARLARMTAQRAQWKKQIDDINSQLAEMNDLAHDECTGVAGSDTTGVSGEGPNCRRDRREADQFRADSKLDERQADLAALDKQIRDVTAAVQVSQETYGRRLSAAIAAKVTQKEADQGIIGLLDRDAGLGRLSDESTFVFAAHWLVRLLLIALDCLPVLVKMIGGTTRYDRLVGAQLELAEELHGRYLKTQSQRDATDRRADAEGFDEADRAVRARRQAAQRAEIDDLAERLFRRSGGDRRAAGRKIPDARQPEAFASGRATVNGSRMGGEAE